MPVPPVVVNIGLPKALDDALAIVLKPSATKLAGGLLALLEGQLKRLGQLPEERLLARVEARMLSEERRQKALGRLREIAEGLDFDQQRLLAEEVLTLVPIDRFVMPALPMAKRIFLGSDFDEPDTPTWKMWKQLLARACDRERVGEAHPAFSTIIADLSLDEVLIVQQLIEIHRGVRVSGVLHDVTSQRLGLVFPQMVMAYNAHLEGLGVCFTASTAHYIGAVGRAMRVDNIPVSELSPFGVLFAEATLEPTPRA